MLTSSLNKANLLIYQPFAKSQKKSSDFTIRNEQIKRIFFINEQCFKTWIHFLLARKLKKIYILKPVIYFCSSAENIMTCQSGMQNRLELMGRTYDTEEDGESQREFFALRRNEMRWKIPGLMAWHCKWYFLVKYK